MGEQTGEKLPEPPQEDLYLAPSIEGALPVSQGDIAHGTDQGLYGAYRFQAV